MMWFLIAVMLCYCVGGHYAEAKQASIFADVIDNPKTVTIAQILKNIGKFEIFLECLAASQRKALLDPILLPTAPDGASKYTLIAPTDEAFKAFGVLDFLKNVNDPVKQKENYTAFIDSLLFDDVHSIDQLRGGDAICTKGGDRIYFDFAHEYIATLNTYGMGNIIVVSAVPLTQTIKAMMPLELQARLPKSVSKGCTSCFDALQRLGLAEQCKKCLRSAAYVDVLKKQPSGPLTMLVPTDNALKNLPLKQKLRVNNRNVQQERYQALVKYWFIDADVSLASLCDENNNVTRTGEEVMVAGDKYGKFELVYGLTRCIFIDTVPVNPFIKGLLQ